MVGGGMTPVLAAGFNNVADTYHVSIPRVALTTGLYMLGLGLGSVVASPTAILYGKRPVYLIAIVVFLLSSIWCALSPNCTNLHPFLLDNLSNVNRSLPCGCPDRSGYGCLAGRVPTIRNCSRDLLFA